MFFSRTFRKTAAIAFAFLLTAALFTGCGGEEEKGNGNVIKGKEAYAGKDYKTAAMIFALAAQEGDAEGQYLLGRCYWDGKGVEEDEDEAFKWIRKSADQGFAKAQFVLAGAPVEETPEERNALYKKAVPGLRKAADRGDAEAMYLLGTAYREGSGVKKDEKEGMKLLRKAAEMGDENAIRLLKDYGSVTTNG